MADMEKILLSTHAAPQSTYFVLACVANKNSQGVKRNFYGYMGFKFSGLKVEYLDLVLPK